MKIILFTHSQDIDGMGSIILAKEAFKRDDFEYVTCKTFEITDKVLAYFESGMFETYDMIFVTDLCIKEPLLEKIEKSIVKSKIKVLDHHKSEIDEGNNKYDFVDVIVEQNGVRQSGTSLFYSYLLQNKMIERTLFLDEFVEATRQYDVWEWIKFNNKNAKYLNILFEELGIESYLKIIQEMVRDNSKITFDAYCVKVISNYESNLQAELEKIYKTAKKASIDVNGIEYKICFVDAEYKYRNEIPDFVQKKDAAIDLVGINIVDGETISYRSINSNIDCSIIGKRFGGKGHKAVATNPKDNSDFKRFYQEVICS